MAAIKSKNRILLGGVLCLTAFVAPARADTVVLVDGNRFENVRVLFHDNRVNVIFFDSSILTYEESEVASIANAPVTWDPGVSVEEFERRSREQLAAINDRIQEQEKLRAEREQELSRQALFRSAFVPGLGQFYSDHYVRGVLFAGGALYLAGRIFTAGQARSQARVAYADRTTPLILTLGAAFYGRSLEAAAAANLLYFDARRNEVVRTEDDISRNAMLLGILWFVNALEAYWFPKNPDDEEFRPGVSTGFRFDVQYFSGSSGDSKHTLDERYAFRLHIVF